jgi:hypothetical protein
VEEVVDVVVRVNLEDLLEADLVALVGLNSKTAPDKELLGPTSSRPGVVSHELFKIGSASDWDACGGRKRRVRAIAIRCSCSFAVSDSL